MTKPALLLPRVAARRGCLALLLFLAGCQELQGPVWSPDGTQVAYTMYTPPLAPGGRVETSVYLVDPDDETAPAILLCPDAAFPRWVPDGPSLYFLGHRDAEGFYTSILMHRPGGRMLGEGMLAEIIRDPREHFVGFQLSADGTAGLLCSAKDAKPGAAQTIALYNVRDKNRVSLAQLGEVYSPALAPNGRIVAYAQKSTTPGGKPFVAVLELDRTPLQPKIVFPTEDENEPAATTYIIHAFPDSDRFLFYAPLGKDVFTVRRDGSRLQRHNLPPNYTAPLMVTIADDGKTATFTVAKPGQGGLQYEVLEFSFARDTSSRLDAGGNEWLGGHALDPRILRRGGAPNWAWLSPAGLALGAPNKARYYPQTAEEHVAACTLYLRQRQPDKALAAALKARQLKPPPEDLGALGRAEAQAYLARGEASRAAETYERAFLLYPVSRDGLPLVFPPQSGVPARFDPGAALKEMDAFVAAAPASKLLGALRQAFAARTVGQSQVAQESYRVALQNAPAEELVGGVKFQMALVALEDNQPALAGENWEGAARCAGFPQADYAAGLSAMAYKLDGKPASVERADRVLRLGLELNTSLRPDLERLPRELQGRVYMQKRTEAEDSKSADQTLRAWVQVTEYHLPQAFLRPARMLDAEGRTVERRLGAVRVVISEVQVAGLPGGTHTLARVPFAISRPKFAPASQLIAFLAQGEVFPLPDAFCEVYAVNLAGNILYGSTPALSTGRLAARQVINDFTWSGPHRLEITGNEVDAWGNQSPFRKSVPLAGRIE